MLRVMPIYGTRPEAIKMAPIVKALEASDQFECVVTVTGQHREMLDQVNQLFGIKPQHDLNIIQPRQTLNDVLTNTIRGLDDLFAEDKPDAVVVQGDTTTVMAGALAAFNSGIPVIHVEAGLRSFDLFPPSPRRGTARSLRRLPACTLRQPPQAGTTCCERMSTLPRSSSPATRSSMPSSRWWAVSCRSPTHVSRHWPQRADAWCW